MNVVAHVGVKDEVELIGSCIRHLESIGVDGVIVCDLGSSDGTLDVIDEYSGDGVEVVRAVDLELGDIDAFKRRNVEIVKQTGADWVMFLDADERWLPATGKVKECASLAGHDLLSVQRFNVILSDASRVPDLPVVERYGEVLLHVGTVDGFRRRFEAGTAPPWSRFVPARKVMARPSMIETIGTGGHKACAEKGQVLREAVPPDLLIAHLPFTTEGRFARKIRNLGRMLDIHDGYFAPGMAWHWRKWSELADDSEIAAEFSRQIVAGGELERLRRTGAIRSAAEMLRA